MVKTLTLAYIDHLQHMNANDLAFYPLNTLEKALESGYVLACYENDEPAGYLWHGPARAGFDITIYQACVDYSARRRHLGWGMVGELIELGKTSASLGIRLKCRSSSESNEFWKLIGFYCTHVSQGGAARSAHLNHWRVDIAASLFTPATVEPSNKPINLTDYNKMKRDGVEMPSRFSRKHY